MLLRSSRTRKWLFLLAFAKKIVALLSIRQSKTFSLLYFITYLPIEFHDVRTCLLFRFLSSTRLLMHLHKIFINRWQCDLRCSLWFDIDISNWIRPLFILLCFSFILCSCLYAPSSGIWTTLPAAGVLAFNLNEANLIWNEWMNGRLKLPFIWLSIEIKIWTDYSCNHCI